MEHLRGWWSKIQLTWLMFRNWLQGRLSTAQLRHAWESQTFPMPTGTGDFVLTPMPEEEIRQMLRGTRDFLVTTDPDGAVSAQCKKCAREMWLSSKDDLLWFYCPGCQRTSFNPLLNVQRDVGFAQKDGKPLRYELFFPQQLPPDWQSPFQPTRPPTDAELADRLQFTDLHVQFKRAGLRLTLPNAHWQLMHPLCALRGEIEIYTFMHQVGWPAAAQFNYKPGLSITLFPVPPGTHLEALPTLAAQVITPLQPEQILRAPHALLPQHLLALGHYGHIASPFPDQLYSVYQFFVPLGTRGAVITFEIVDAVLAQARPEFGQIMHSLTRAD